MRKIILQNMITLDGFFEGPKREIDWHMVDDEFNQYAIGLLKSVDTLIFGRLTYELMASYWPSEAALRDDPIVAERMNNLQKIVFSTSLDKADWKNTRLVKNDPAAEIERLKQQPGKDMAIFGSSDLATSLIPAALIDEYRFFISPIVLGKGKTIFAGLNKRTDLKLIKNQTLENGVVALFYEALR